MTVDIRDELHTSIVQQLNKVADVLVDSYSKVYDALPSTLSTDQKKELVATISNDVVKILNNSLADMDNIFESKLNDKNYMDKIISSIKGVTE